MVKIKTEKKMNLIELIEHILESDIKEQIFEVYNNGHWDRAVDVNAFRRIILEYEEDGKFTLDNLFAVTVEEEITEKTEVPELLEIYSYYGSNSVNSCVYSEENIADQRDADSIAFHMLHPDGTTTLLWTDEGGMVE